MKKFINTPIIVNWVNHVLAGASVGASSGLYMVLG